MIPSLVGRMQTRFVMMATLGVAWSGVFSWLTGVAFADLISVLFLATVLGFGWEYIYHRIAQRRWDRDFPSGLFLVAAIPELIVLLVVLDSAVYRPGIVTAHFVGLWISVWLFLQGPMRVIVPRWRFRHGRVW